jgi:hypothetical protein
MTPIEHPSSPSGATNAQPARWYRRPPFWRGEVRPAFWTITGILSLIVNAILIAVIILLLRAAFVIRQVVGEQLVGGLHENFIKMDAARITTSVTVNTTIPVQFTLPVSFELPVQTNTQVVLTEDTVINNATVDLKTGGLVLYSEGTDIILPKGTSLPVALDIRVPVNANIPVDTTVPVHLDVPVDIPLNQTELHEPFVGLQNVIGPYDSLLSKLPSSWNELLCAKDAQGKCQ